MMTAAMKTERLASAIVDRYFSSPDVTEPVCVDDLSFDNPDVMNAIEEELAPSLKVQQQELEIFLKKEIMSRLPQKQARELTLLAMAMAWAMREEAEKLAFVLGKATGKRLAKEEGGNILH